MMSKKCWREGNVELCEQTVCDHDHCLSYATEPSFEEKQVQALATENAELKARAAELQKGKQTYVDTARNFRTGALMTTDDLQNLSNDELSRLAAEAQGWMFAREVSIDECFRVSKCAVDLPCGCRMSPEVLREHWHNPIGRRVEVGSSLIPAPPTNLPQAAELFMGMSEGQRMDAAIDLTGHGTPWDDLVYILNPETGARNLTIACLAAMEVGL